MRLVAVSGWSGPSPFSQIAKARSKSGRAPARSPWARSRPARSLRLVAVLGWSGPSPLSQIAKARSKSGRAPARSPCRDGLLDRSQGRADRRVHDPGDRQRGTPDLAPRLTHLGLLGDDGVVRLITTTSVIGFAGGEPTHDQALRSDDRCNQLDEVERIVTCKVTRILSDTKAKPAPPAPRSARDRPEPFFGCLVDPSGESPDARLISQSGLAKSPCCGFATRSLTGVGGCRHRLFLHAILIF